MFLEVCRNSQGAQSWQRRDRNSDRPGDVSREIPKRDAVTLGITTHLTISTSRRGFAIIGAVRIPRNTITMLSIALFASRHVLVSVSVIPGSSWAILPHRRVDISLISRCLSLIWRYSNKCRALTYFNRVFETIGPLVSLNCC